MQQVFLDSLSKWEAEMKKKHRQTFLAMQEGRMPIPPSNVKSRLRSSFSNEKKTRDRQAFFAMEKGTLPMPPSSFSHSTTDSKKTTMRRNAN